MTRPSEISKNKGYLSQCLHRTVANLSWTQHIKTQFIFYYPSIMN